MKRARCETAGAAPGERELRQALEQAGWRFTRQRAAVYKALEALVACRLATKVWFDDGPCRYDCRGDAHYHFRCLKTQQVHDLDTPFDPGLLDKLDPQLVESLRRRGFHVTGYRLELLGHRED